jgi:hypothetical protein
MSRSGYSDDCEDVLAWGRWRGRVASAIRGKRGQAFLKELLAALDALPEKRLVANDLKVTGYGDQYGSAYYGDWGDPLIVGGDELVDIRGNTKCIGDVCALGALGVARNLDMSKVDPEDSDSVAGLFDIVHPLACEIMFENDEQYPLETPEMRFARMRKWIASLISNASATADSPSSGVNSNECSGVTVREAGE